MPEGPYRAAILLDACSNERRIEEKVACFRRATRDDPKAPQLQLQFAEALLAAIQARQTPCEDTRTESCAAEAEAALRAAATLDPKAWRAGYLMSKVLLARGDAVGAARLLTQACPRAAEGDQCWQEALITAVKSGSVEAISTAANAFAARPCEGSESCADKFDWLASNIQASNPGLANTFFGKAAEADPSAQRWLKVAEHASQAGLYGVARAALERADRSPDASVTSRAQAELLKERIARGAGGLL